MPVAEQYEHDEWKGEWYYRVADFGQCQQWKDGHGSCDTKFFATHDEAAMAWLDRFGIVKPSPPTAEQFEQAREWIRTPSEIGKVT